MTMDDLELLQVRIFSDFRVISQISEATTAKRMKIDPYCITLMLLGVPQLGPTEYNGD